MVPPRGGVCAKWQGIVGNWVSRGGFVDKPIGIRDRGGAVVR